MRTAKRADVATLFFGEYRRRVLGLLLLHPDEAFHLREIARLTRTQPGTLRRELASLAEAGVLERRKVGNQVHYKANPAYPIYRELRDILRKTSGVLQLAVRGSQDASEYPVMTKAQGAAFKARWARVAAAERDELRTTSVDQKLRQLAALMASAAKLGWNEALAAEEIQARQQWQRLRRAYGV